MLWRGAGQSRTLCDENMSELGADKDEKDSSVVSHEQGHFSRSLNQLQSVFNGLCLISTDWNAPKQSIVK